jgi:hypothetical protein
MLKSLGKTPGSGRKAGTPNKDSLDLHKIADELGIHPFRILLHFAAGNWKELGYSSENDIKYTQTGTPFEVRVIQPEVRMKAAAQAAEYLYPKRKLIEEIQLPPPDGAKGKLSFSEFCTTAGYPAPFPKQIEMMDFGIDEIGSRMILGSRGYGKTDYVTVAGIAYDIYLNPDTTNLIITKSKTRNGALLAEIAKMLEKNGIELEKNNSEAVRIMGLRGKDHSVSATTVKSVSLRGRHPKRIVMDDPVTPDDVSEATRLQVQRCYNEVCKLTQNVLVIGQPVHQYDLFEHLRPLIKKMEVPFGSIPELDPDLQAMKLAGVDDASISASYHLKVLSDGTSPFQKVRFLETFPTGDSAVAFIDPSFDGGDYTAISIVKAYMQGVAVVGFVYKKAWNNCLDEIAGKLMQYSVKRLCFETNSLGEQPLEILRSVFRSVGVVGKKSNGNKHSRIVAAGTFAHMIHLSQESDRNYLDQVIKYEYKSKHDDAPDSLSSCLEWIGLIRGRK